jgi:hypothetical protein
MPVVDGGGSLIGPGGGTGDSLPPEARKELEELFQQGTGDPNSEKDRELREKAGEILERYGIDPREMGTGHDGTSREGMNSPREAFEQWERSEQGRTTDPAVVEQYREQAEQYQAEFERGGGFERALEQMSPEAHEQMERMSEHEHGPMEGSQRESSREVEAAERSFEAPSREHEATTREYEAPTREYEAPTREVEAPTHEYEAPTHEYEAPTQEQERPTYEAPQYEAPQPQYEAPGPGDGSQSGTPSY